MPKQKRWELVGPPVTFVRGKALDADRAVALIRRNLRRQGLAGFPELIVGALMALRPGESVTVYLRDGPRSRAHDPPLGPRRHSWPRWNPHSRRMREVE